MSNIIWESVVKYIQVKYGTKKLLHETKSFVNNFKNHYCLIKQVLSSTSFNANKTYTNIKEIFEDDPFGWSLTEMK